MAEPSGRTRREGLIVAIGVLKLAKAALLVALGVGGLVEMPEDLAHATHRALGWAGGHPGGELVQRLIERVPSVDDRTLRRLGVASLCYAAVFLVEGVGLVRRKTWAEWLTVLVTASFLPLELYELTRRVSAPRAAALAINLAILGYLVVGRIRAARRATSSRSAPAAAPGPALRPDPQRA